MSEMSARARRRAFTWGSCTRKGLMTLPGLPPNVERPGVDAGAAGAGAATGGGATGRGAGGAAAATGGGGVGGGGGGAGGGGAGGGAAAAAGAGVADAPLALIGKTVRHTEQRARTPAGGTLPGSMRKMVEQVGQVAFIASAF